MNKPKIGSRIRVLLLSPTTDNPNLVYFGEGIVKSYYPEGCTLLMVKEFARYNYNIAKLGDKQKFDEAWIELAKNKKALQVVKRFLNGKPKIMKEPFVFR